ncbi:PREDICTED: PHD finger-like domain-containing protein 5A isoform X1 [Crocodylus porosus]|uniref:PHD finger-like domain-containing protein 5A isoform X1 n=1 Tax=Crocodylus porosus TaxID=8502 RepID=UPI00093B85EE|nr:PREDICTED: PHD finger-like domain-containing protein 5A isoform X1 [Crocodylus porosus]
MSSLGDRTSRLSLIWVCWGGLYHCCPLIGKGSVVLSVQQPFAGDGKCVICDSYVRPCTLVRICDECNYGSYQGRCVICGGPGVSDAYYCKECTIQEKDRDGCPKIVNLGSSKTDLFYERKKYGFKKR